MTTIDYENIPLEQHDPKGFVDSNSKLNHIGFVDVLHKLFKESGVDATYSYPEEPSSVTVEIVERGPATLSSKTIGEQSTMRRPYKWKEEFNVTDNTETSYKIQFFDNVALITCWGQSILDTEIIAAKIEAVFIKKYQVLRKNVDSVNYQGRLKPGFSSAYNDRKLYSIPLVVSFRTSEIFYESSPILREIEIQTGQ